ncbi:hypothetical protein HDU98_006827 [Podochytrium sp. JEL0797]|nr:hypothetical protein HDU98_006827 [Podochytrium sp. JEL0797]
MASIDALLADLDGSLTGFAPAPAAAPNPAAANSAAMSTMDDLESELYDFLDDYGDDEEESPDAIKADQFTFEPPPFLSAHETKPEPSQLDDEETAVNVPNGSEMGVSVDLASAGLKKVAPEVVMRSPDVANAAQRQQPAPRARTPAVEQVSVAAPVQEIRNVSQAESLPSKAAEIEASAKPPRYTHVYGAIVPPAKISEISAPVSPAPPPNSVAVEEIVVAPPVIPTSPKNQISQPEPTPSTVVVAAQEADTPNSPSSMASESDYGPIRPISMLDSDVQVQIIRMRGQVDRTRILINEQLRLRSMPPLQPGQYTLPPMSPQLQRTKAEKRTSIISTIGQAVASAYSSVTSPTTPTPLSQEDQLQAMRDELARTKSELAEKMLRNQEMLRQHNQQTTQVPGFPPSGSAPARAPVPASAPARAADSEFPGVDKVIEYKKPSKGADTASVTSGKSGKSEKNAGWGLFRSKSTKSLKEKPAAVPSDAEKPKKKATVNYSSMGSMR